LCLSDPQLEGSGPRAPLPSLASPLVWCTGAVLAGDSLQLRGTPMAIPAPDLERVRSEDHALARAVVKGDPESLAQLAVRLRSVCRILGYLDQRAGGILDDHELADLTQDVVMIVWRKLPEFEGLSTLESWFYGICVLELRNAVRRRMRRRGAAADEQALEQVVAPEAPPDDNESVHQALKRIGRDEARIIRLKHFEELTFEQIGSLLDVSPNTIKARYYRGLEELRGLLRKGADTA
jgi:RNA polymerase sigma-70 factor, ECF subfamily